MKKLAGLLLLASSWCYSGALTVGVEHGTTVARRADNTEVWRVYRPRAEQMQTLESDKSQQFNTSGRLRFSASRPTIDQPSDVAAAPSRASWDPLTELSSVVPFEYTKPIFDLAGNAFLLVSDTSVRSIESNGTSANWQSPEVIPGLVLESGLAPPVIAMDPTGLIHAVCRTIDSQGNYALTWSSHAPGGTWTTAQTIYSSPSFFENFSIATDSAGDAVVVFDLPSSKGSQYPGAWSLVYSKSAGTWGTAQQISAAGETAYLQTLASSSGGSFVYLAYLDPGTGIRFVTFSGASVAWGPPSTVPETSRASASLVTVGSKYPMAVDSLGNATLVAPFYAGHDTKYKLEGLHYQSGVWIAGKTLLPWDSVDNDGDILNFGDVALNAAGDVLVISAAYAPPNLNFDVFRFQPAKGWDVEVAAQTSSNSGIIPLSVAWFETAGEAVVIYSVEGLLTSTLYVKGSWSISPVIPLKKQDGGSGSVATAPTGEVLLTVDTSFYTDNAGLLVSWLRP